jgi:hypothetical protein
LDIAGFEIFDVSSFLRINNVIFQHWYLNSSMVLNNFALTTQMKDYSNFSTITCLF